LETGSGTPGHALDAAGDSGNGTSRVSSAATGSRRLDEPERLVGLHDSHEGRHGAAAVRRQDSGPLSHRIRSVGRRHHRRPGERTLVSAAVCGSTTQSPRSTTIAAAFRRRGLANDGLGQRPAGGPALRGLRSIHLRHHRCAERRREAGIAGAGVGSDGRRSAASWKTGQRTARHLVHIGFQPCRSSDWN
jgi:hypothetical protein